MIDWNGFDKGVIGRKLPSDKTLNNMRKSDLIEYLHIAEQNHNVLAFAYRNAVDNSKCNRCPIPKMSKKHDEQIRADFAHELKEIFNSELPSNYASTQPFFTLENVRALVDMVLKE